MTAMTLGSARASGNSFYVWMAGVCVLIAFAGFAPTYWLQLAPPTFIGAPLIHLHAALFSAWTLLFLSQTALAANGRLDHHRAWGIAGVSLATAMIVVGAATTILSLNLGIAAGFGDLARQFSIVPISGLIVFAGFVVTAIVNVTRPEIHKRLMLLATVSLLQAAVGRVFFTIIVGGGPGRRPGIGQPGSVASTVPAGFIVDLVIVAAMIYDWRTRGRPHTAYLIGGALLLAVQLLRVPLATTPAWLHIADYLAAFAK